MCVIRAEKFFQKKSALNLLQMAVHQDVQLMNILTQGNYTSIFNNF